jgi:hypothetical protein
MACRVPVVVSENCHFPQVAEAGAGRVVALETGAVAAALLDIASAGPQASPPDGRRGAASRGRTLHVGKVAARSVEAYGRVT